VLFVYAMTLTRNSVDAEDLVEEAYFRTQGREKVDEAFGISITIFASFVFSKNGDNFCSGVVATTQAICGLPPALESDLSRSPNSL